MYVPVRGVTEEKSTSCLRKCEEKIFLENQPKWFVKNLKYLKNGVGYTLDYHSLNYIRKIVNILLDQSVDV